MHLIQYRQAMVAVRMEPDEPDPEWAVGEPLVTISRTADELSVFCPTNCLPEPVPGPVEGPFIVVRIAGQLEFSQIGVLLRLLKPLADAGIPALCASTFDTDWVLLPASSAAAATSVWRNSGYTVEEEEEQEVVT